MSRSCARATTLFARPPDLSADLGTTLRTVAMPVAAERPPMKVSRVSSSCRPAMGRASTNISPSAVPSGNRTRPAIATGTTNRLMITRVRREQPGGFVDVGLIGVLDDRDVELTGPAEDREQREQGHGHPAGAIDPAGEQTVQLGIRVDLGDELANPPRRHPR
jgi:hypothetical protein